MSITKLRINNFRNISSLDINAESNKVICFVGENGSSKTSLLSLLVEGVIMNTPTNFPNYSDKGMRYRAVSASEIKKHEKFYSFEMTYNDIFNRAFTYKKLVLNDRDLSPEIYSESISGIQIRNSFFGEECHRVSKVESKEDYIHSSVFLYRPGSRYEPYELDFNKVDSEYDKLESSENNWGIFPYSFEVSYVGKNLKSILLEMAYDAVLGYKDARLGLDKIRDVLNKISEKDFGRITISQSPYRSINFENIGNVESFSQGEMDILVTISAIIKRQLYIYQRYSHMERESSGIDSFLKIPGIVIIDEIDLHLHPKAQERYITILTDIFPNINFIISTHSPFIVRGLPDNSIVVSLPSGHAFEENFKAMDIDSITKIIFRYEGGFSSETLSLLRKFKSLIASENKDFDKLKDIYKALSSSESAKEELELLMATFSNPAEMRVIEGKQQ